LEKLFLKIFIVVVAASAAVGFAGNIIFDIKARCTASGTVADLTELSRKGDADGLLKRQQFLDVLLYSSVGDNLWQDESSFGENAGEIDSLFETTARFALLARELNGAEPSFSTVLNESRTAIWGELSFVRDDKHLCMLDAIMVNRQDRYRNDHWILSGFINSKQMVERTKKTIEERMTGSEIKNQIEISIRGGPRPPAPPVPSVMAAAGGLRNRCADLLLKLDKTNPFDFALFETYPGESIKTVIERFEATAEELESDALFNIKGLISYIPDEAKRVSVRRLIERWRAGWLDGVCTCEELFNGLKDCFSGVQDERAKPSLGIIDNIANVVTSQKNGFIGSVKEKALEYGASPEALESFLKTTPPDFKVVRNLIPEERRGRFDAVSVWMELKFKKAVEQLIESKLLPSLLGWSGNLKSDYGKKRIEKLLKEVEAKKVGVEKLLEEFISPRLRYNEALFVLNELINEFDSRKARMFEHIKTAVNAVEDDVLRKELLEEVERAAKAGAFDIEALLKRIQDKQDEAMYKVLESELSKLGNPELFDIKWLIKEFKEKGYEALNKQLQPEINKLGEKKPFDVAALIKNLNAKKVSVFPYEQSASELPYSVFVAGALNKFTGYASEAFSLLKRISELKDASLKRKCLLMGSDKTVPPLPGLFNWITSDIGYSDELRATLLAAADKCLSDENEPVEPLIEALKKSCEEKMVVETIRTIAFKRLVDQLPLSSVKLKWQRAVEGRLAMSKSTYLSLLRSLRAVSGEREVIRNLFPSLLRVVILYPEALTYDHIGMIRNYAERASIEIDKRYYALKEQKAATTSPQKLIESIEPLKNTIKTLSDGKQPFSIDAIKGLIAEAEKVAEENLMPTDATKRRLLEFYKRLVFGGDSPEIFDSLKGEIEFLRSVLAQQDVDELNRIVEERPITWRSDLASLVKLALGASAYADVLSILGRLNDGLSFDYEKGKEEIAAFIGSEEFLRSAAIEQLRKRVLPLVLRDEKNKESEARYSRLRKLLADISDADEKTIEQVVAIATEDGNIQLRLIQLLSGQVRGLVGRTWLNEACGKYLLGILSDSVWGREGCSPRVAREALLKDLTERSFSYNMKCWFVSRSSSISAASLEKNRRDNFDGEIKNAVEWILKQMVYISNYMNKEPYSASSLKDSAPPETRDAKRETAVREMLEKFITLTGNDEGKAKEMLSLMSKEQLNVSTIYEVYDYNRRGVIRRGYIEKVGTKYAKIRETTRKMLVLLEGKEEEDIESDAQKIIELCKELRAIKDGTDCITYDIMFVRRLTENWRMYWCVEKFLPKPDKSVVRAAVEQRTKEGAVLVGVEEW